MIKYGISSVQSTTTLFFEIQRLVETSNVKDLQKKRTARERFYLIILIQSLGGVIYDSAVLNNQVF